MKIFLLLILSFFTLHNINAQLMYNWAYTLNGDQNQSDYTEKITCDQYGSSYVVGTARGIDLSGENITVVKYASNGTYMRINYNKGDFRDDYGKDIAVDALGNIYVLGLSDQTDEFADGFQIVVLKYNSFGGLVWIQSLPYSTMNTKSMSLDALGNVYVSGTYYTPAPESKIRFISAKINSSGSIQWTNTGNTYETDFIYPRHTIVKGNFFYTLNQYSVPGPEYSEIIKYNLSGDVIWFKRIPAALQGFEWNSQKLGLDTNDNVYIAGFTNGFSNVFPFLARFDSSGTFKYANKFDSLFAGGKYNDMVVNENNIYCTGYWENTIFMTAKYDSTGTKTWAKYGNETTDSEGKAIQVTGDRVYVTGTEWGGPSSFYDFRTIVYNKNTGALMDTELYNSAPSTSDMPRSMAVTPLRGVVITGQKSSMEVEDWLTVKYQSSLLYVPRLVSTPGIYDFTIMGPAPHSNGGNITDNSGAYGTIASLNVASLTGSGNVYVNFFAERTSNITFSGTAPANTSDYSWVISKDDAITVINSQVRFDYTQIENAGITNASDVRIYKRDTPGSGDFIELATTLAGTELRADVTSFGEFMLGSNTQPLPVELSSFTANVNKMDVSLRWTTASELNCASYEIERKNINANDWNKISVLKGNGTTSTTSLYSFEDKNLATAKYNYRLKQIDYNGAFNYYNLDQEVIVGIPEKFSLSQNYPNPFNPATKINFEIPENVNGELSNVKLLVYDITGRLVSELVNKQLSAGYYTADFNGINLSSGIYFYTLSVQSAGSTQNSHLTKKMLLIK